MRSQAPNFPEQGRLGEALKKSRTSQGHSRAPGAGEGQSLEFRSWVSRVSVGTDAGV